MRRIVAARSLGLVVACAGVAHGQQAAPLPPAVEAPAPAELPQGLDARPMPGPGAVLAVPRFPMRPTAPPAAAGTLPGIEMPALVGPAEGVGPDPSPAPGAPGLPPWAAAPGELGRGAPPMVLETTPEGSAVPFANPNAATLPPPRPGLDRTRRGPLSLPPPPPPAPRRPRLFGRLQPPPFLRGRSSAGSDDSIAVEPRSDPAADAALKRRIEQQVDTAAGSKLRDLDVRVVGRDVTIRARVTRFWFRRGVKRTIESLPALAGYRTNVEVMD